MDIYTVIAVFLASTLACVVTTIGIYVIGKHEEWGRRNTVYFISFAAGVLITVSFIHLIPKSFSMNIHASLYLLAGFMGLYLFNRLITIFVCHKFGSSNLSIGIIPTLGIGFHSFLDGIIYSVTFNVSIFTGVLAAIGMVLHEFPEGIVTFLLLEKGGLKKKHASTTAFLAAAITTPLGTLVSFPIIQHISRSSLGALLALSAGALVYVGASHLLPAVEREEKRYTLISLASGILVAVIIVMSKG
jgi:zinc and cadmium transporter